MSAILNKVISSFFMAITGLFVVRNIGGGKIHKNSIIGYIILILSIIVPIFNYGDKYSFFSTIIVYILLVFSYKDILKISFTKITIACSIMMLSAALLDCIISGIVVPFLSFERARENIYICIISSTSISIILLLIFNNRIIKDNFQKFILRISDKRSTNVIIFFVLMIIAISIILYVISINFKMNEMFTISFLIVLIFDSLVIILMIEKSNYDKLSNEYDVLFNYVKIFEDWIENEQLNRHEFKNQLAILRCMTKEKKVKDKIDSIINDNINIDNKMINQLKNLPNGGFKGLLYYKIVIAKNLKVNIDVDVSKGVNQKLKKYNNTELKIISNLIGIYCDNAIEAAKETKRKLVLIEIYTYSDQINVVISNTFNQDKYISNRYQKGVSSKGQGRGNGLYFANKIISKNKWIIEKQEEINDLYIQKLYIRKIKN